MMMMGTAVRVLVRGLVTEYRYTYRSARRDAWSRRRSARMFAREAGKVLRDLPIAVREARAA